MGNGFYFLRGSFSSEVSLGLLFSHLVKSDISRKDRIEKEFGQGRKQRNSQEEKKKHSSLLSSIWNKMFLYFSGYFWIQKTEGECLQLFVTLSKKLQKLKRYSYYKIWNIWPNLLFSILINSMLLRNFKTMNFCC